MKKFFYGLGALFVILIVAVLVAPGFIDWNQFKPQIISQAERLTGRQMAIDGAIDLALLPRPTLSVNEVRMANIEGASSPDMVRLTALDVRVAFVPLLSGIIQVERIILVEPHLELERTTDGLVNWRFGDGGLAQPSPTGDPARPVDRSERLSISFDQVSIEDGRLVYRDAAGGVTESIEQINLEVSATSLTGPYNAMGTLSARGLPLTVDSSIGEFIEGRPLTVRADLQSGGAQIYVSGNLATGGPPAFNGKVRLKSEGLAPLTRLAAAVSGLPVVAPIDVEQVISAQGALVYGDDKVSINDLELRLADTLAKGSVSLDMGAVPRFDLTLSANRLNADLLLAGVAADAAGAGGDPAEQEVDATGEVVDAGAIGGFSVPMELAGTIDLAADAILYREQVIRQSLLNVGIIGGTINVQRVSALLPGGSDITAFGTIEARDGLPYFTGQFDAASDNFRALLNWMQVDVAAIPADRLRQLSCSAAINGGLENGQVTDIDIRLDGNRLVGGVAYALRDRPAFGINLRLDHLNANAYLKPARTGTAAPDDTLEAADGGASDASNMPGPLAFLTLFDADFVAQVDSLTYNDLRIDGIALKGLLQGGELTLHSGKVDDLAGGTAVTASGMLGNLDGLPSFDGRLEIDSPRLAALARMFPAVAALPPSLGGRFELNSELTGDANGITVDGTARILDGDIVVKGAVDGLAAVPSFDVSLAVDDPNPVQLANLMRDLGLIGERDVLPDPIGLRGDVKGNLATFDLDAALTMADAELSVAGRFTDLLVAPAFDATSKLRHPNAGAMLQMIGAVEPGRAPIGLGQPLVVDVTATGPLAALDVAAGIRLGDSQADVKGRIDGLPAPPSYELVTSISNPSMIDLLARFGIDQDTQGFDGPVEISGRLTGNPVLISLPNLDARLGSSSIVGSLAVSMEGPRPKLIADVITGAIVVEHFLLTSAVAPPATGGNPASGGNPAVDGSVATGRRRGGDWSREPIDVSGLQSIDANLKVAADALTYGGYRFDNAELTLRIENSVLDVDQLSGRIFDGRVDLRARLDARALPELELSFNIDGADLHKGLMQAAQVDSITGRVGGVAKVTTRGRSVFELVSSLNGDGKIASQTGGVITGLDLRALSDQLDNLDNLGDFLNLAKLSFDGGQTRYSELAGTFDVVNGQVQTSDTRLLADGGVGTVVGLADLPRWVVDLTAMFHLTDHPEAPPVGVHLTGPIDNPQQDVKSQDMEQFLMARGLGGVLERVVPTDELGPAGPLLENLLGIGDGAGSSAPAPAPAGAPVEPAAAPNNLPDDVDPIGSVIENVIGAPPDPAPTPSDTDAAPPPVEPAPADRPAGDQPEDVFKDLIENLLNQ